MPRLGKNISHNSHQLGFLPGWYGIFWGDDDEEEKEPSTEIDISFPEDYSATVRRTLTVSDPAMEGQDVLTVQRRLLAHGYKLPQYGADGGYGSETAAAVRKFQQDNRLPITGNVGSDTWKALQQPPAPGLLGELKPALQQFWRPLSTGQKLMYGLGGAAMAAGTGIAIYNSLKK